MSAAEPVDDGPTGEPTSRSGGVPGPLLGIDPGTRRIGVAVSDAGGTIALPLEVVQRGKDDAWVRRIAELAEERGVAGVVVGLPVRMDGSEGPEAAEARRLAGILEQRLGVPAVLVDERFTSVAANRAMASADVDSRRRRPVVDKVAAAILLQSHLDALR
ncbi:MAG TPA: Holliday junction resolvase RuvX, partial [Actinomycetota bacterium]